MARRKRRPRKVKVTYADGSVEYRKAGSFKVKTSSRKARYDAYLRSPQWKRLRKAALERDDHRCRSCRRTTKLQVHHHTYERIGRELLSDVVTLCDDCHRAHHRGMNVISREAS